MSLQVFRDGRPDKEANKVSNALLARMQRDDDHAQILDDYLKSGAAGDGTYGHMGSIGDITGKQLVVPKAMLGGTSTRAERIARVRARMAKGEPPLTLFYDEVTDQEILSEEDAEAYEEGWICPECIQYQNILSNDCNWRFVGETPMHGPKGCGFRRDIF